MIDLKNSDLRIFAQQLVDLTVKDVNDLKEALEEYYPSDSCYCILQDYKLSPKYFIPRKYIIIKNRFYVDTYKRSLLIKHRKII